MSAQDLAIVTDRIYDDLCAADEYVKNLPYMYSTRQTYRNFVETLKELGRSIDGLTKTYGAPACIYELRENFKIVVLNLKTTRESGMVRGEPSGSMWKSGFYRN